MCVEQCIKTYWRQRWRPIVNPLHHVLQICKVNIRRF